RGERAAATDAVARRAGALPLVERSPPQRIAYADRGRLVEAGADECDHARQLRRLQLERRHAGTRHAVRDDAPEILVRRGASEHATSQVHARNAVAVAAVALHALRAVDAITRGDLGLRVLRAVVRLTVERRGREQDERGDANWAARRQ